MRGTGLPPGQAQPYAVWPEALKSALALILSTRAQIIMFTGPDFLAFYNDAYAATIGEKHPRALGNPAAGNWSELWQDLESLLHHVRSTGQSISEKDRRFYIERFGYPETVYFDIDFSPVRGCDGAIEAVLCIVAETTDRVAALRDLKANQSRMQAVLSGAAAGLCSVTPTGLITEVNAPFAAMLGEAPEELIGRSLQSLIDPRDWQQSWLDQTAPLLQRCEVRYRRADGQRLWVSQVLCDVGGSAESITGSLCLLTTDITHKRQEETELRRMAAIIEGSDDAIMAIDLNMTITSWNHGAERLYGWPAAEVTGTSVLRLLPEGRSDEEARILAEIRDGKRVEPYETTRLCRGGQQVPVSLTVSPIYDAAGEIIGASKIARDISARLKAQRVRDYLLFEMKHRVKNILAVVVALARQTLGGLQLPEYDAFIARVHSLSRAQDLLTQTDRGTIALEALISSVLEPFRSEKFSVSGPPQPVPGDLVLTVTLALHELVTNALKYGALSRPEGRVAIRWVVQEAGPDSPARLRLTWTESGGPPVTRPLRQGFGSVLIRDLLAATLQADITLNFAAGGVEFAAEFPLSVLSAAPEDL